MPQEIVYTSAERGLRVGSRGFCTVASSASIPQNLATQLESLSAYRHLFPPGDAQASLNPVVYSYLVINAAGHRQNVLSRICDAGLDYSQRTNKLAHHVALNPAELPPGGPAWLLAQPGFMIAQWNGEARKLPPKMLPGGTPPSAGICNSWKQVTGDAGWAGVLAQSALSGQKSDAYIIFQPGMDMLSLIGEALLLLPAQHRWLVTFSTYFTTLPPGLECRWRCVVAGSPEAAAAARSPSALHIDLSSRLPAAPEGPLVTAARTGRVPSGKTSSPPPISPATESPSAPANGLEAATVQRPVAPDTTPDRASLPPLPPPGTRQQPPALAPRPAARPFPMKTFAVSAAVCLILLAVVGGAFAVRNHWQKAREGELNKLASASDGVQTLLQTIRSTSGQIDRHQEKVGAWIGQLKTIHTDLSQHAGGASIAEALMAAADQIEALNERLTKIKSGLASLPEVQSLDEEGIKKVEAEIRTKEAELDGLEGDVADANTRAGQLKQIAARLAELDRLCAEIDEAEIPIYVATTKSQLDLWERESAKFEKILDRAWQDFGEAPVTVQLEQLLAEVKKSRTEVIEKIPRLEIKADKSLQGYRDKAEQAAQLGIDSTQFAKLNKLEHLEEALQRHRETLAPYLRKIDGLSDPTQPVASNGGPKDSAGDIEELAGGLPAVGNSALHGSPPARADLVRLPDVDAAPAVKLRLLGVPPGIGGPSFGLHLADAAESDEATQTWRVETTDGDAFAGFRFADNVLSFAWDKRAAQLSETPAQLRRCILLIQRGQESYALALMKSRTGRPFRFDPGQQLTQALEVPVLPGETLQLTVATNESVYEVTHGGGAPGSATLRLKQHAKDSKVTCILELNVPDGMNPSKQDAAELTGQVRMETGEGQQPDPADWMIRKVRILSTQIKQLDGKIKSLPPQSGGRGPRDKEIAKLKDELRIKQMEKERWLTLIDELDKLFKDLRIGFEVFRVHPQEDVKVISYVGRVESE